MAAALLAAAGCGGSKGGETLSCPMSAASACPMSSDFPCDATWAQTQTDPNLCLPGGAGVGRTNEYDCGGYHVLHEVSIDGGLDIYYDATTGAPVALVWLVYGTHAPSCVGGPPAFTLPSGCPDPDTSPLVPQCRPDAGTPG